MALQTREFTGSTGSQYWTWKIVVTEDNYIENGVVSTKKVNITIDSYIGRKTTAGGSYFDGRATLKFTAGTQSQSKSFVGGTSLGAGAWYKIGSHTFVVDNNGTKENPTQLSVGGSLVDAGFSPYSANASGTLSLTPLHTPPQIHSITGTEMNETMKNLGIDGNTVVQLLSFKSFSVNMTLFDNASIANVSVYHNNTIVGAADNLDYVHVNFPVVGELVDNGTGYIALQFIITDSLGGQTSIIQNYPVIKYTRPSIDSAASLIKRKTGNGVVLTDNKAVLNFAGTCYKGNNAIGNWNTPFVQYKIWVDGTPEPNDYTTLETPNIPNISILNYELNNIIYTNVYNYKIKIGDSYIPQDTTFGVKVSKVPTGRSVWSEYKDRVDFYNISVQNGFPLDYSYNETRIGTWLGKPLYRKVIEFKFGQSAWNGGARWLEKSLSDFLPDDVIDDSFLKLWYVKENKYNLPITFVATSGNENYGVTNQFFKNYVRVTLGEMEDYNNWINYTQQLVVEYTKTSD